MLQAKLPVDYKSDQSSDARKVKRPGKYSRRKKAHDKLKHSKLRKPSCYNYLSSSCDGGKKYPARKIICFKCGKKGHFKGAKACKGRDKQTNCVEDLSYSPSPVSSTDTETNRIPPANLKRRFLAPNVFLDNTYLPVE